MAHILIVEDDQWIADCYAKWLAAEGHSICFSRDAQEAIDSIDDLPPELIILDLLLPNANGIQLLHTLQSYSDLASIPVILCSSSFPEELPDITAYGVASICPKPDLTPHRLRHEITRALRHAAV
jgi:CheY-like chemotaxis protein